MAKPSGSGDMVKDAAVQGKLTFLSGEICFPRGERIRPLRSPSQPSGRKRPAGGSTEFLRRRLKLAVNGEKSKGVLTNPVRTRHLLAKVLSEQSVEVEVARDGPCDPELA
jgi:hypothetical protein